MIRKKHLSLIKRMARSFHRTTGIEYEELYSRAALAYVEAKEVYAHKYYNPEKGDLNSFYYTFIESELIKFCKKTGRDTGETVFKFDHDILPTKGQQDDVDLIYSLSDKARQIYALIAKAPQDFLVICHDGKISPKKSRGVLYKKLREKGWSWQDIWDCFDELKAVINETG